MDTNDLSRLLTELDPAELRQRIADLDRERSALAVLLRAVTSRQLGRRTSRPTAPAEGGAHA
jgi:hypothetical protein